MKRVLNMCRVLNISEFWIFVSFGKYDSSEYVSGWDFGRVLNIPGFRVYKISTYVSVSQGSEYAWIWLNNALWQGSEYAWSSFHRVLNKPPVLNMPGLRIWEG